MLIKLYKCKERYFPQVLRTVKSKTTILAQSVAIVAIFLCKQGYNITGCYIQPHIRNPLAYLVNQASETPEPLYNTKFGVQVQKCVRYPDHFISRVKSVGYIGK